LDLNRVAFFLKCNQKQRQDQYRIGRGAGSYEVGGIEIVLNPNTAEDYPHRAGIDIENSDLQVFARRIMLLQGGMLR
jgi:hypothetical protein